MITMVPGRQTGSNRADVLHHEMTPGMTPGMTVFLTGFLLRRGAVSKGILQELHDADAV